MVWLRRQLGHSTSLVGDKQGRQHGHSSNLTCGKLGWQLGHSTSLTSGKARKYINEMVLLNIQNMVKLMDKKIVTVLHIKCLHIWTAVPVLVCLSLITTCIESKVLLYYFLLIHHVEDTKQGLYTLLIGEYAVIKRV